ncbi:MAG: hypothetical protein LBV03_03565 [Fusobacteriales bacterium]|nr:hypothetical protein [Fusobacteriales bacterium]
MILQQLKEYIEYDKEKLFLLLKEKVKSGELRRRVDIQETEGSKRKLEKDKSQIVVFSFYHSLCF